MTKNLILIACVLIATFSYSQNIGIGTNNPKARLHIADSNVLFTGNPNLPITPNDPPIAGPGTRLMWYADKAAFRTGGVDGTYWDGVYIGNYSFAAGFNVKADGVSCIAMGRTCSASGQESLAMGFSSLSYGNQAITIGSSNASVGTSAISLGYNADAIDNYSVAIGNFVTASGEYSTAIGNYVSTSGFEGAFAMGDHSTNVTMSSFVANGFRTRFAGGYRLFTNSAATIGALLNANANSWAVLSDMRLKENFLPVDGESFLQKIAAMPQFTWNYKGQDVKTLRHYGPMAQDFYAAFGNDAFGEIGCDTVINQQDFIGVNFIAIQAMEKRTTQLKKETGETITMLLQRIELLEVQNKRLLQLLEEKRK